VAIAEAWPTCAGDGAPAPPPRNRRLSVQLSALVSGWAVAYAGDDARLIRGDAANHAGAFLRVARLGFCGQLRTAKGNLWWDVVYEPWDLVEHAQPEARAWGRFAVAEVGFTPLPALTVSLGIHKLAFSFGHDEPEQLLPLPLRPYVSNSIAPDRRFGATLGVDLGVVKLVLGLYEGARDLTITADGGFLITGRLIMEPIGPVGNAVSTLLDAPYWRRRPRFALNASVLFAYAPSTSTYALGPDVVFKWGPFGIVFEYLFDSGTLTEQPVWLMPRTHAARDGLYVESALMLWRPWIELAARYEWLDDAHEPTQRFSALTAGVTVNPLRQYLRLQAAYTRKFHYPISNIADDILLFAATGSF
jgi:hypothetical protein